MDIQVRLSPTLLLVQIASRSINGDSRLIDQLLEFADATPVAMPVCMPFPVVREL